MEINEATYKRLKKEYCKAINEGNTQFPFLMEDGVTVPLITDYAKYVLEHMEHILGIVPKHDIVQSKQLELPF